MAFKQAEYEHVVAQIKRWTPDLRLTLVRDVLDTLSTQEKRSQRTPTLPLALGLLATDQSAPTDEIIKKGSLWEKKRNT